MSSDALAAADDEWAVLKRRWNHVTGSRVVAAARGPDWLVREEGDDGDLAGPGDGVCVAIYRVDGVGAVGIGHWPLEDVAEYDLEDTNE